jgi:hypothetical protein
MASTSNIEILKIFQSNALHITDAPWYVTNALLRRDLHSPSIKEEIQRLSSQYSARLNSNPNLLTATLKKRPTNRRLRCILPPDFLYKFRCKSFLYFQFLSLDVSLSPKSQRAPDPILTTEEC